MNNLSNQLESLQSDRQGMEEELGTSMASQLTSQEQNDLKNIHEQINSRNRILEEKVNSQAPEPLRGPRARFARSGENGEGEVRSL